MKNLMCLVTGFFCLAFLVNHQIGSNDGIFAPHTDGDPNPGKEKTINPEGVWLDDRGIPIQAHGGGVIRLGDTYYWFGEDRTPGLDPDVRYVSCYSSKDLMNWTFLSQAFQLSDLYGLGKGWVLERPKVFFDQTHQNYVMYAHIDNAAYQLQSVVTAESKSIIGPYELVRNFRPLGNASGDIGEFVERGNNHYLLSSGTKGLYIYKLAADDLDVDKEVAFLPGAIEGAALARYNNEYYLVVSDKTWWNPNSNKYATADKLEGPWSTFKNIAPPEVKTYGSQSSMLLQIDGSLSSKLILMADQWDPERLYASRYNWMPLDVRGKRVVLPSPKSWGIDVRTGSIFIWTQRERVIGMAGFRHGPLSRARQRNGGAGRPLGV
jgi:hypothetical protein